MNESREKMIQWLHAYLDVFAILNAWLLAFLLRFYGPISVPKGVPEWEVYFKLVPFIVLIWFFVFLVGGVYKPNLQHRKLSFETLRLLKLCFFAGILFVTVTYFYDEYRYSRLTLLFFVILHPILILFFRSFLRKVLRIYKKSNPARKILLVGAGNELLSKSYNLVQTLNLGSFKVVGVLHVGREALKEESQDFANFLKAPLLDIPNDWEIFIKAHPCEAVYISIPHEESAFIASNLEKLASQVLEIKVIPDLSYLNKCALGLDIVANTPVVNIHDSPLKGISHFHKRIVDITGSVVSLLVFSPLMVLSALFVRLSSPGPVFYKQERMGLDGKTFSIYKFRTMPVDIENSTGAVWASKNDGRSTWFGRILRKTSLDELPQLFNVIKGEMSLVGPRPERPVFVGKFRVDIPQYMVRHKVKAGMTGWAQINGWRGNTSIEKRIECDLFYIQNWSLWLDVKILFLTVFKGFRSPNAY